MFSTVAEFLVHGIAMASHRPPSQAPQFRVIHGQAKKWDRHRYRPPDAENQGRLNGDFGVCPYFFALPNVFRDSN